MTEPSDAARIIAARMGQLEYRRDVLNAALDREMERLQRLMSYELSWTER